MRLTTLINIAWTLAAFCAGFATACGVVAVALRIFGKPEFANWLLACCVSSAIGLLASIASEAIERDLERRRMERAFRGKW